MGTTTHHAPLARVYQDGSAPSRCKQRHRWKTTTWAGSERTGRERPEERNERKVNDCR